MTCIRAGLVLLLAGALAHGHPAPKPDLPAELPGLWKLEWRGLPFFAWFTAEGGYWWGTVPPAGSETAWYPGSWREARAGGLVVHECGRSYRWLLRPTADGWTGHAQAAPTDCDLNPIAFHISLRRF